MKLRPYQEKIIAGVRERMLAGVRSILIQSPTGSGKTALTAEMFKRAQSKGMASWFVVHRRELVKQSIRAFDKAGVGAGIVAAGFPESKRYPIQIASIQTLAGRLNRIIKPTLVVWDECHHVAAGSWVKVRNACPDAFHIGLTATPQRLDGRGLKEHFSEMINGPSVQTLIAEGFLSPYKLYAPSGVDVHGVRSRMGDFVKSELGRIVDKPSITGDVVSHYIRYAAGRRAVVFCVSIEHSKHVVERFKQVGIMAEHVDGETEASERDGAIKRFESGETMILSNVELFGEGFDLPAIEAAILLRPTQSLGLYLQQVGRALRPSPGKENAIILDHAGNCERHGMPDEDRDWSLDGHDRALKKSESEVKVKVCPKCYAAQLPGSLSCRFCGVLFPLKPREVDHRDGELVEVDSAVVARAKKNYEQARATTLNDLINIGRQRGYRRPELWAKHVFNARQLRKIARGQI